MSKKKLLEYIQKNYSKVVIEAQGGPYIEIDLVPDAQGNILDVVETFIKTKIDTSILTRSYEVKSEDGLRENRYWYFMQDTTRDIMKDLKR